MAKGKGVTGVSEGRWNRYARRIQEGRRGSGSLLS